MAVSPVHTSSVERCATSPLLLVAELHEEVDEQLVVLPATVSSMWGER